MKSNNNSTLLLKFKIFVEFLISFCAFYFILNNPVSVFMSFIIGFSAIFVLMQALGNIDKLNGYGKYNKSNNQQNFEPHHDYNDFHQDTMDDNTDDTTNITHETELDDDTQNDIENDLPDINDNSDFLIENSSDFHSMDNIIE